MSTKTLGNFYTVSCCYCVTYKAEWTGREVKGEVMAEPVVKISNLDFRFDSNLPFVLRDVTMEVARGRYI